MAQILAIVLFAAIIAMASAQYLAGGLGYGRLGYAGHGYAGGLGYGGLGYGRGLGYAGYGGLARGYGAYPGAFYG